MFTDKANTDDRGQVGIGVLIVFIAMVLVAAIAAGVLINTAGFLQTAAEDTGTETQAQVTDRLAVMASVGHVDDGNITQVDLTVAKTPGSGDINLERVTIHWLSSAEATTLTSDDFNITAIGDADDTIISDSADRHVIEIELGDGSELSELGTGDRVTLTLTTASGAERVVRLSVPEMVDGDGVVGL